MDMEKTRIGSQCTGKETSLLSSMTERKRRNPFKIITVPRPEAPKKQDLRGKLIRKMKYKGKNNGKWSDEEQKRFLVAIKLFGTYWPALQVFIPTRTSGQIRSHSQKYFLGEKRMEVLKLKQQGDLDKTKFFICKNYRNWEYDGKFTQEKAEKVHKLKEQYFPDCSEQNLWDMDRHSQHAATNYRTNPGYQLKEDNLLVDLDSSPAQSLIPEEPPLEFKIEDEGYFAKDMFFSGEKELSISQNSNFFEEDLAFFNADYMQSKEAFREDPFSSEQELI